MCERDKISEIERKCIIITLYLCVYTSWAFFVCLCEYVCVPGDETVMGKCVCLGCVSTLVRVNMFYVRNGKTRINLVACEMVCAFRCCLYITACDAGSD